MFLLNLDPQICVFSLLSNETEISHKAHEQFTSKQEVDLQESIYGPVGAFSMEHPEGNDQETDYGYSHLDVWQILPPKQTKWAWDSGGGE